MPSLVEVSFINLRGRYRHIVGTADRRAEPPHIGRNIGVARGEPKKEIGSVSGQPWRQREMRDDDRNHATLNDSEGALNFMRDEFDIPFWKHLSDNQRHVVRFENLLAGINRDPKQAVQVPVGLPDLILRRNDLDIEPDLGNVTRADHLVV